MGRRHRKGNAFGLSTTTGDPCAPIHVDGQDGSRITPVLPGTGGHAGRRRRRSGASRGALAALLAVAVAGLLLVFVLYGLR